MSAASATSARDLPRRSRTPSDPPLVLVVLVGGAISTAVGLLAVGLWHDRATLAGEAWALAAWVCAIAVVGLVAVPSGNGTQLSLDTPLAIAAAFIYGPWVGGGLALLGYSDLREFRGEVSLVRGVYNRAQVTLSVIAAGAIFQELSPDGIEWPGSLVAAGVAVTGDAAVNYCLVGAAKALMERRSTIETLRALRLGSLGSFAATYLAYGLMSVVLAEVYQGAAAWGLLTFIMPLVLARTTFERTRVLEDAGARLRAQSRALQESSLRVAEERRDERMSIAADLHDEVLPSLFQAHLMAQVIRRDLAGGRLLALEEDVPALVEAVEKASSTVRAVVRGLRGSPLGVNGVRRTLELLVEQLRTVAEAEFDLDIEEIKGPPVVQLLAYQIVREALNNAVRHAGATRIRVRLRGEAGVLRILVEDDGCGFDPRGVDGSLHFGLSMMKERVELMGGVLHVSSTPGVGTRIVARLPVVVGSDH